MRAAAGPHGRRARSTAAAPELAERALRASSCLGRARGPHARASVHRGADRAGRSRSARRGGRAPARARPRSRSWRTATTSRSWASARRDELRDPPRLPGAAPRLRAGPRAHRGHRRPRGDVRLVHRGARRGLRDPPRRPPARALPQGDRAGHGAAAQAREAAPRTLTLERAAGTVDEGRRGCAAAFALPYPDGWRRRHAHELTDALPSIGRGGVDVLRLRPRPGCVREAAKRRPTARSRRSSAARRDRAGPAGGSAKRPARRTARAAARGNRPRCGPGRSGGIEAAGRGPEPVIAPAARLSSAQHGQALVLDQQGTGAAAKGCRARGQQSSWSSSPVPRRGDPNCSSVAIERASRAAAAGGADGLGRAIWPWIIGLAFGGGVPARRAARRRHRGLHAAARALRRTLQSAPSNT